MSEHKEHQSKIYQELEFDSFNELNTFLNKIHYRLYYRGVSNYNYQLKSRLQRVFEDNNIDKNLWYFKEIHGILYFKRNYKSLFVKYPDESDIISWLSLMQHYGAPTRLLDWSLSPFIALYFAYNSKTATDTNNAALWIINPELILNGVLDNQNNFDYDFININRKTQEGINKCDEINKKIESPENILKRLNPIIEQVIEENNRPFFIPIEAFYSDQRIIAQQGCFTIQCDLLQSFDEIGNTKGEFTMQKQIIKLFNTGKNSEAIKNNGNLVSFIKVKLPFAWKNEIMKSLQKMNITAASIFPGIAGLGIATEDYIISRNLLVSKINFLLEKNNQDFKRDRI